MLTRRGNQIISYNPFREMEEWERRMFGDRYGLVGESFRTDVKDTGEAYELSADLPGFDKEDIHLDINGDVLTVSASHNDEKEEKDEDGKYLCRERYTSSYRRAFNLDGVHADDIHAKYENGVLKLTLPKEQAKVPASRRLTIE